MNRTLVRFCLWLVVLSISIVILAPAAWANKPILAVMTIQDTRDRGAFRAKILENATDYMRQRLVASGKYLVVDKSRQDEAMISAHRKKSMQACVDESCQIELGRELAADTMLRSTVSKIAGYCNLGAAFIDLEKSAQVSAAVFKFNCNEEGLIFAVDNIVAKLVGDPPVACIQDKVCIPGMECVRGKCQAPQDECRLNSDCGPGMICKNGDCEQGHGTGGFVPQCRMNSDCGPGQQCSNGQCMGGGGGGQIECRFRSDCSPGMTCQAGRCVQDIECRLNSDCQSGKMCKDGKCVASGPPPGSVEVSVTSKPEGAIAFFNGVQICDATPCSVYLLKGKGDFEFTHPRYKPAKITKYIRYPMDPVHVEMDPNFGWLTVTTEPSGARVTLDGRDFATSDFLDKDLNAGGYTVEIFLTGFRPVTRRITIHPGQRERIAVKLEGKTGTLIVKAKDAKGRYTTGTVLVNGEEKGQTSRPITLPEGTHTVMVQTAKGNATQRVTISDGKSQTETLTVKPSPILALSGAKDAVLDTAISKDGKLIVGAIKGGDIAVWDRASARVVYTYDKHKVDVYAVAMTGDGAYVASGDRTGKLRIWRTDGKGYGRSFSPHEAAIWDVAISPDDNWVATASADNTLKVLDRKTGKERFTLKGHDGQVFAVNWSPDGKFLASGGADGVVRLWKAQTGTLMYEMKRHDGPVNCVSFSPDSKRLASGGHDGYINIWTTANGRYERDLKGHDSYVRSLAFSKNGRWLISGGLDSDGGLRVWDSKSWRLLGRLSGHGDTITSLCCDGSGQHVVSASWDRSLRVWRIEDALKEQQG